MLTAYFDGSGTHFDSKNIVFCGFVSSVEQRLPGEDLEVVVDWRF
jgi:hypothetical protein